MKLGCFLKSYRRRHNLLQKEMAAKLRITREYYWKIEHGVTAPSTLVLSHISQLIGANVEVSVRGIPLISNREDLAGICALCSQLEDDDLMYVTRLIQRLGHAKG
jgi:transcriptional regulator with XRE-family HTH domain